MKLQKCSLFIAMAGALMLTAALAPSARATTNQPLVYFNFEDGTLNSVPAPGPGGSYPFLQNQTITQSATDPFPAGNFTVVAGPGATPADLAHNALAGDTNTTTSALDLRGNTSAMGSTSMYCFEFGANTTGYTDVSLSFALNSIGNKGQFDTITLLYATVASPIQTDFTQIGSPITISQGAGYYVITSPLPAGATNQANLTLEFCLSGSANNAEGNATFIDNIQVNAIIPEPSTYFGGLLGILGLCWCKRRWFTRFLHLRCA